MACRFAHDDRREGVVGDLGDSVGRVPSLVPELRQRKPEGGANLVGVERERLILFEMECMGRHDHGLGRPGAAREIAEVAEVFGPGELEPDFLQRLTAGRRPRGIIPAFEPTAGKRHMTRPGIIRPHRALDEEYLRTGVAFAQYHCDGRIGRRPGVHRGSRPPRQTRANEIDPHSAQA